MDKESRIGVELTTVWLQACRRIVFRQSDRHPRDLERLDLPQAAESAHLPDQGRRAVDAEFRLRRRRHQQPARVPRQHDTKARCRSAIGCPASEHQTQIVMGRRDGELSTTASAATSSRIAAATSAASTRKIRSTSRRQYSMARAPRFSPSGYSAFLQGPTPIRPWLKIRMPTFHFTNAEDDTMVELLHRAVGPAACRICSSTPT